VKAASPPSRTNWETNCLEDLENRMSASDSVRKPFDSGDKSVTPATYTFR
jgi:hypothetical protein